MQNNSFQGPEPADAPEEAIPGAAATFKKAQLRLLMKEHEEAVSKLAGLGYTIWTLEEFFRSGCND
ncbi:MAG: hypothetical protein JRM80_02370 [Nitrososphaerota archaeon]|nr:hypothetical protein [Nitrososphaerota archaeon]